MIVHHEAVSCIAGVDRGVKAGDVVNVGRTVELECMDTPGHTMCAGNCHNGGNAEKLYATLVDRLARLPDDTLACQSGPTRRLCSRQAAGVAKPLVSIDCGRLGRCKQRTGMY